MKKSALLIIILFEFCLKGLGQNYYELGRAIDFIMLNEKESRHANQLTETDIKGSPYLNDDFVTGNVITTNKIKYEGLSLRYNIFNDEMEFQGENNLVLSISTPGMIEKIEYGELNIVYKSYFTGKKEEKGFFIVLEEGKAALYKKPEVVFKEAKKAGAYSDPLPARFERNLDDFYIKIVNRPAMSAMRKKELPEIFPDHIAEIESYIKANKTRPGKEDDLKDLVKYYNSL